MDLKNHDTYSGIRRINFIQDQTLILTLSEHNIGNANWILTIVTTLTSNVCQKLLVL